MATLPYRWLHAIFTILMAFMMSGVMTFVGTAVNFGFSADFLSRWLRFYGIAFFVAIPAIYIFAPFAKKLAEIFVESKP